MGNIAVSAALLAGRQPRSLQLVTMCASLWVTSLFDVAMRGGTDIILLRFQC
jgi:hypothetical protein